MAVAVPTAILRARTLAQAHVTAKLQRIVAGRHRIADLHRRIMLRRRPTTGVAPPPPITVEAAGTRVAGGTRDTAKLRTHCPKNFRTRRLRIDGVSFWQQVRGNELVLRQTPRGT
jgi:hypothetical protein